MRKLPIEEIQRPSLQDFKAQPKTPLTVMLDNIRSRANVGTILRSADAFALEAAVLGGFTPQPPHRDIRKTALGAEESVAWRATEQLLPEIHRLKAEGYQILALEHTERSLPLPAFRPSAPNIVLLLGNEVEGVQQELLDHCDISLEIPQFGTKHSLNVGVAAGIAFYVLQQALGGSRGR